MVPNPGSIVLLPDKLKKEWNKVKRTSPGLRERLAKRTHGRTSSFRQGPQAIAAMMICDGRISIIQLGIPAGEIDRVGEGIVEYDYASGLEQLVNEDQVDEHVVKKMAAVNEGEIEISLLPYEFGQEELRGLFFDLDEFLEAGVPDISSTRTVVFDRFIRVDHEMRPDPCTIFEEGFEDKKSR